MNHFKCEKCGRDMGDIDEPICHQCEVEEQDGERLSWHPRPPAKGGSINHNAIASDLRAALKTEKQSQEGKNDRA
jgi:hypothetical protein